jgi:hypothetical protein
MFMDRKSANPAKVAKTGANANESSGDINVAASPEHVWAVVSDKKRLGEWSGAYRSHHRRNVVFEPEGPEKKLIWETAPKKFYQEQVRWTLRLTENGKGTTITETCKPLDAGRPMGRLVSRLARLRPPVRTPDLLADLARLKIIIAAPDPPALDDKLLALLNVYSTQFGSYTTLLWQVPVLGLTAQAFLLTIALGSQISDGARIAASGLSIIIACASWWLMHSQRGRAINQAELARRTSAKLSLKSFLGDDFRLDDAVPPQTNAQDVWDVDHLIYQVWKLCMALFIVADIFIIVSVSAGFKWFT